MPRGLLGSLLAAGGVAGVVVAPVRGEAQVLATGVLRGRLVGPHGEPLPGVRLSVAPDGETEGGAAAVTETDRLGQFTVLGLDPGWFRVTVGAVRDGFVAGASAGAVLSVQAGETAEVVLRMAPGTGQLTARPVGELDGGELLESTAVSARAGMGPDPVADPASVAGSAAAAGPGPRANGGQSPRPAKRGAGAEAGSTAALPVESRQWEALAATRAAVHETTLAGGGAAQDATEEDTASARAEGETGSAATGLSVAGLPAVQDAETVDGLSAEQSFRSGPRGAAVGGPRLGSGFAQGAVLSVRVMPHTFSAQYGGAAGALVAVRSRGAGTRVHGSAFFQERNSAWAATNPFAVVSRFAGGVATSALERPADADQQFGGALGWPLLRGGRLGVFAAYEGQRRVRTVVSSPQTSGFFSLSAMQTALLGNRGVGAAAREAALEYLSGLGGVATVESPRTLGFLRIQAAVGRWDQVEVGGQVQRLVSPALSGLGVSGGVVSEALSSIGTSQVGAEAVSAGWEHRFRTRAVNRVEAQAVRDLEYEAPAAPNAQVPAIGPGGYAPEVLIEPEGFRYGTPASLGRIAYPDERRWQVAEAFQLRAGRHVITLGGDWSRVQDRVLSATNLEGTFLYDSGNTGGHAGGLVDWMTDYTFNVHAYPNGGCPSVYASVHYFCFRSYSQSFAGTRATAFVRHDVAGFAEDALRIGPGLLLTLGARYDYALLPFPQTPNPTLDTLLRQWSAPVMGLTSSFPEDRNNVAPRVALAWSPGGRHGRGFTAQVGYGLFYGRLPGATIQAALADTALPGAASSTNSIRILPTTEVNCPQVANQGFGYPCAFVAEPAGVVTRTGGAAVFARNFRLPAVQRGSLALQGSLGRHVFLEGAYAMAVATQLPASVDVNVAPSTAMASFVLEGGDGHPGLRSGEIFQVPLYTARRTTLYGPVTAIESNANATFHSGTVTAAVRSWHGLEVRGSYAFARAIDYGPQSSPTPRQNGQFDPFTNGYDKGLSNLQFAHHLAGTLSWRSDWRPGSRELRALLGGWRVGAIGTAGSGAPYSYVLFGGTRLAGGHESINGSGGATYLPTVGRNTFRLPPRGKVDLRAAREVRLGDRWRLELRADAFNLLNSVSLSRVETRAFLLGTPAATGAPTPLVFQDAATVASEGLTTPAFGTPLSSTSALSRERQLELGMKVTF